MVCTQDLESLENDSSRCLLKNTPGSSQPASKDSIEQVTLLAPESERCSQSLTQDGVLGGVVSDLGEL